MADTAALKTQILNIIQEMEQEGMVDEQLAMAYRMKEIQECGPFYFFHLLPTFMNDSRVTLRNMTTKLEKPEVDFHEIGEFIFKIKGASSCIGACRMAQICREFLKPVEDKSKQQCIMKLEALKHEFSILQEKLSILHEIERRIVTNARPK